METIELFRKEIFENYGKLGKKPNKILMKKYYHDILCAECNTAITLKDGYDRTIFGIPIEIDNTIRDGYKLVYED